MAAIAATGAALLITGCGQVENGAIIAAPPGVQLNQSKASIDDALASFRRQLAAELGQASATQGSSETSALAAEANALASDPALIGAERMDALKSLGAQAAAQREAIVASLITAARQDSKLSGVRLDGANVQSAVLGLLNATDQELQALAGEIAADTLADVLRNNVISLSSSTYVYGLVEPQAHEMMAAGDAAYAAYSLQRIHDQLVGEMNNGGSSDPHYNQEASLARQLQSEIGSAESTSSSAFGRVSVLTAAGFPGNQGVLSAERQALANLSGPSGALTVAQNDISQIKFYLAERQ